MNLPIICTTLLLFLQTTPTVVSAGYSSYFSSTGNQEDLDLPSDSWTYQLYTTKDAIHNLNKPPAQAPGIDVPIPPQFQYIVGLDQVGIASYDGYGMSAGGDPEFAISMSSGTWEMKKKNMIAKPTLYQSVNRCGNGWSLFAHNKSYEWAEDKKIKKTGHSFLKTFFEKDKNCHLYIHWNKDATKGKIHNYFNAKGQGPLDLVFNLEFEMNPYWRWKFGKKVSVKESIQAKLMDKKCCPSTKCSGGGTLGKEGDTDCETISMACGPVKDEDVKECPLFFRNNFVAGSKAPYKVYALGDKYGNPTPYADHFVKAYEEHGVTDIFHLLERK